MAYQKQQEKSLTTSGIGSEREAVPAHLKLIRFDASVVVLPANYENVACRVLLAPYVVVGCGSVPVLCHLKAILQKPSSAQSQHCHTQQGAKALGLAQAESTRSLSLSDQYIVNFAGGDIAFIAYINP